MSTLHVFDMDGTLLRGSACLDLSRHVGALDAVNEIEERWGRGQVGHVEFYDLCIPLWSGLTEDDIDEVFAGADWLDGLDEVWKDIAARGEHSAVISLSPQFFVDRLLERGVHSAHGAGVRADAAVDPATVLTPDHKPRIVAELLNRYELTIDECVAYGDSSSDVPLFEMLPNTVAVNGTGSIVSVARAHYEGDDLREAYALGRAMIDGAAT